MKPLGKHSLRREDRLNLWCHGLKTQKYPYILLGQQFPIGMKKHRITAKAIDHIAIAQLLKKTMGNGFVLRSRSA
jgi:hypothetical protein